MSTPSRVRSMVEKLPSVGGDNSTSAPLAETVGGGEPVLQSEDRVDTFLYVVGPITRRYYVKWESPPNFNTESQPFDYLVAVPPVVQKPAPVLLGLHAWGGTFERDYGWWYNAEKGAILVASNMRPYDWWTGFHERLFTANPPKSPDDWARGVVRPYAQRRLLTFLDWVATR